MNELTINLNSRSKKPLYEQIYDHIKSDIQNGRLRYGEKLPSTRALSKHLEVSRSTVELAYEQLLSEGYIESAPYRGFFVAQIDELYQLKKEEKKLIGEVARSTGMLSNEKFVSKAPQAKIDEEKND